MTTIKSEPLTYDEHAPVSFFQDVVRSSRGLDAAAEGRLERHAKEMRVISEERNQRAYRALRAGDFEYRVEPGTTPGTGGYFTPPAWLNQLFATAKRPGRVLAGLMSKFDLPNGVSSVNLPIIGTGTTAQPMADGTAVPSTDVTDSPGSSTVATFAGMSDTSLQLLEQSPAGAHLDQSFFRDLTEAYDADLEAQLLTGLGSAVKQLSGIQTVASTSVTYSDMSPSGAAMYPYFGQAGAQLADARRQPPEVWLMRTARWMWLMTQESTGGYPYGILSPFFVGNDVQTPDPIGGLLGLPVFLDEAIAATTGTTENEDTVICLRPSDLILLEGQPQLDVMREALSGSLGVRLRFHNRVAAITNRYVTGIATISGSGFVVEENY